MVMMFVVVWSLALWLVCVFSVMGSELLMTSAISCSMWSSMYECQRVEYPFTSPVRYVCDVLYVSVSCFVVCGGIYIFVFVICIVLLMCTMTI